MDSDSRAVSSGERILPDMQEEMKRKTGNAETNCLPGCLSPGKGGAGKRKHQPLFSGTLGLTN